MAKGFIQCPEDKTWGYIPEGFDERKHLAMHSICGNKMILNRTLDPITDLALPTSKFTDKYILVVEAI